MAKKTKKISKKPVKKARSISSGQAAKKVTKPVSSFGVIPLGDRVLVKPIEMGVERSPSGIIIPDSGNKEKAGRGKVVAIGEGRRTDGGALVPPRVSIGDVVMFSKYGFDEITVDDVEYYIVNEPSILAIIK